MTRSILAALAASAAMVAILGTGCQSTGVGDPCTPEQEYLATFTGFNVQEVSTEAESFQCQTRLCLVNHFQGRVSCPYGQNATGMGVPPATQGCFTPGLPTAVTGPLNSAGKAENAKTGFAVPAQCLDRTANDTVYCSCRCADIDGNQSGGTFCNCPSGFSCTQLVSSLSASEEQGLTGAYCIKDGTAYSNSATSTSATACAGGECGQSGLANCGNSANNGGS